MSRIPAYQPTPATPSPSGSHGPDSREPLVSLSRTLLRRLTILTAATLLVAGSLTAQAYEHQLATSITPRTQRGIPPHRCSPTICTIERPALQVAGGWPYPYLPAVLIIAGLGCGLVAVSLARQARKSSAQATSTCDGL